jgi:hypothetical protein
MPGARGYLCRYALLPPGLLEYVLLTTHIFPEIIRVTRITGYHCITEDPMYDAHTAHHNKEFLENNNIILMENCKNKC